MPSLSASVAWLLRHLPISMHLRAREQLRICLGALLGIALTSATAHLALGAGSDVPWLIAPMGASAVLLFTVPASPLAQPWSLLGGNLVSALIGVACAQWLGATALAAAAAVALAIAVMVPLRCVHPPSGAVALTAVLGGPAVHALGFGFLLAPVALDSALLLCAATLYHRVTGHAYPHAARPASRAPAAPARFSRADIDAVLAERDEWMDVDPDDLEKLIRDLELYVRGRRPRGVANAAGRPSAAGAQSRAADRVGPAADGARDVAVDAGVEPPRRTEGGQRAA